LPIELRRWRGATHLSLGRMYCLQFAEAVQLSSSMLGWNIPNWPAVCFNLFARIGQEHALDRRRPLRGREPESPLSCRADWPGRKASAAIGADIEKYVLHAIGAERALVAADARDGGRGREIPVATFAIRAQLQGHLTHLWTWMRSVYQRRPFSKKTMNPRILPKLVPKPVLEWQLHVTNPNTMRWRSLTTSTRSESRPAAASCSATSSAR
jgi:hypothetical protein